MRIAVDFQSTEIRRTGIGVFADNLFAAIREEKPECEFIFYKRKSDAELNTIQRIAWESFEIPAKVYKDKPALIYSPGFSPACVCAAKRVVTVHDLIGLAYPANQKSLSSFYWSRWQPFTLRRAHRLVASSEWTRRDIQRFLGIPPEKVPVVYLACAARFNRVEKKNEFEKIRLKYNLTMPFLASVGTLEPRKNVLGLLRAYESLKRRGKARFSLLIIGKSGTAEPEVRSFILEKNLQGFVKMIGYASDEELALLYNAAIGYVNVSFYEGFGLPVLEAMSCGLSGVLSNRSSLPEVAGNTAILVDPENTDEIADGLLHFTSDGHFRESMSEAAYLRSKEFSMKKMARQMINIFQKEAA